MYQNLRLSKHWLMMDFMHDPAVYGAHAPLPFAEIVTDQVLEQGVRLSVELIEPMMERWGVASICAGYRPRTYGADGPHKWNDEKGAGADFIFHDWVNQEKAPIKLAQELMFSDLTFERIITYSGSEVVCLSVKRDSPRFAIMENVKPRAGAHEKPTFTIHCNCKADHRHYRHGFRDRPDWRRAPNETMYHAKGQIRPHHVRVGRYFTLLDFCRDEFGIERGLPWVVTPKTAKHQMLYARMFTQVLDPLTAAVGRLAVVEGMVTPALAKIYDKETALLRRWTEGPARVKFVLPEGVGHEEALPYLQEAEGVTGIDVEDHGSGDAVAITLQIDPFMPRTFYSAGMPGGFHSGEVPEHLRDDPRFRCDDDHTTDLVV